MKSKAIAILKLSLIALYMSYWASATLFTHTHTGVWGTVTHSHPYLPSSGHTHSTNALHIIAQLTNLLVVVGFFSFVVLLATRFVGVGRQITIFIPTLLAPDCQLRAPPVC